MLALRPALLALLLSACSSPTTPAQPAPVARAEPARTAEPTKVELSKLEPAGPTPVLSTPVDGGKPDRDLCVRFTDHVTEVMTREDPSSRAAVVAMRDEMISRCLSKSTRAELTCGLAATSSADMTKCEGKT